MMTALLIGFILGLAAALALVWAIGAARVGTFLLAFSDALRDAQAPALDPDEIRSKVVAELVELGYSHIEADDAVSMSAQGPRRVAAWRKRAIQAARRAAA